MIRKLFISHFSGDAAEIHEFATALRMRGIVPWVDKKGGFQVADDSERLARRAIRKECFGLALWATHGVFDRPFIRDVEMDEARRLLEDDPTFMLFAVPRSISFDELGRLSSESFGIDLSRFHTLPVERADMLHPAVDEIARQVMARLLAQARPIQRTVVSLQIATREKLPADADDLLVVDACDLLRQSAANSSSWGMLLDGLRDVKAEIATTFGRPRIRVNGSKHLSTGFLIGRVFSPFNLSVRQTPLEEWDSDLDAEEGHPFASVVKEYGRESGTLEVEIASGSKNIRAGIDASEGLLSEPCACRLSLSPRDLVPVDNLRCVAMARQAYGEIERVVSRRCITRIHLFTAAPVSFMTFLGRHFKGMPETVLYEWEEGRYVQSATVPGRIL